MPRTMQALIRVVQLIGTDLSRMTARRAHSCMPELFLLSKGSTAWPTCSSGLAGFPVHTYRARVRPKQEDLSAPNQLPRQTGRFVLYGRSWNQAPAQISCQ